MIVADVSAEHERKHVVSVIELRLQLRKRKSLERQLR